MMGKTPTNKQNPSKLWHNFKCTPQELVAAGTSGSGVNIETKNKMWDLIESQFTKALDSTTKRKTTQLKRWAKDLIRHFSKEDIWKAVSTWKDGQYIISH